MMQNKDEEIIKALEYCTSPKVTEECPRQPKGVTCNDGCEFLLMKDALDLINRQQAEIERLKAEIEETNEADREAEVQALSESKDNAKLFCEAINHTKSEAIKEFVKRLKNRVVKKYAYTDVRIFNEIDNLVKETTEPVKVEHNSLCETETYMGE